MAKNTEIIKGEVVEQPPQEKFIEKPHKKSIFTYIGITVVVVILIAVIVVSLFVANAYRKPVNRLIKGMNRYKSEFIMETLYNEDIITYKRINAKNSNTSWEDYLKNNDEALKTRLKNMNLKKSKCKIVAKEKISGSNFDKIHDFYIDKYDAEITKAYRVEVNMTFKTNGGTETPSGWICVVKVKDEDWKFCPEYSDTHFDFVDEALKFE